MQGLPKLAVAFCLACICAELVSLMTDAGWARQCIKAAAGLYILVVLISMLGVAPSGLPRFEIPQQAPLDLSEESEPFVLSNAARELEQTLSEQCRQQFGVSIRIQIALQKEGGDVSAQAQILFPSGTEELVRKRILNWMEQELGTTPDWREEQPT